MAKVSFDVDSNIGPVIGDWNQFVQVGEKANQVIDEFGEVSKKSFQEASDASSDFSKQLNDNAKEEKKEISNIKDLREELSKLAKARDESTDTKKINEYNRKIDESEKKIKQLTNAGKEGFDEMGNAIEDSGGKFDGLLEVAGGFGLALGLEAIISGIFEVGAAVVETIGEFRTLRGEVQALTGLTGSALDKQVAGAKAIAETYDVEVSEVIKTANVLANEFGLTQEEALAKVKSATLGVAGDTEELLEQTKEYASQIAAAGGDADNLFQIINQSTQEGIFSDKGIDVVKEFGLRIREQSQGTKDALEAAFGPEFTDGILKGVRDGSLSSVEALEQISEKLNDTSIPADRLQTVIADVFGGPGEDAGLRYLQSLTDISGSVEGLIDETNELTRVQLESLDAEERLAEAQNELSKLFSDGSGTSFFTELQALGTEFLVETLTPIIDGIKVIADGFDNTAVVISKTADLIDDNYTQPLLAQINSVDAAERERLKSQILLDQKTIASKLEVLKVQGKLGEAESLALIEKGKANKLLFEEIKKQEQAEKDAANARQQQIDATTVAEQEAAKKAAEKAKAEREKAQKEIEKLEKDFLSTIEKLRADADKEELNRLSGPEKFEAIREARLAEIDELQKNIVARGEELAKARGEEFVLEQEQIDQLNALRDAAREEELAAIAQFNAEKQLAQLESEQKTIELNEQINLRAIEDLENNGMSEVDFELFKEEEKLRIQQEFTQERIDLLEAEIAAKTELAQADGSISAQEQNQLDALELQKANLKDFIDDAQKQRDDLAKQRSKFNLAEFLGVSQEQLDVLKEGISQASSAIVDGLQATFEAQREAAEARVSALEDAEDEAASALDRELQLNEQGFASNVEAKREELAQIKAAKAQAQKEAEEAAKRQFLLDTALQAQGLITSSVNIIQGFTKAFPVIGLGLAIGTIATMFAFFASAKAKAFQAISAGNPQAATGASGRGKTGTVHGRYHSQGGENFTDHLEVEADEDWGVLSRSASKKHGKAFHGFVEGLNAGKSPSDMMDDLLHGTGVYMKKGIDRKIAGRAVEYRQQEIILMANASTDSMEKSLTSIDENMADLTKFTKNKIEYIPVPGGFLRIDHVRNVESFVKKAPYGPNK